MMTVSTESTGQAADRAYAFQCIVGTAPKCRHEEAFAASAAAFWRGESIEMWRAEFTFRILSGEAFLDHDHARPQ